MSNRTYDILNKVCRWLPALGAFYLGLSKIWVWPLGNEVTQTIAEIVTLLAATLEISTVVYNRKQAVEAVNNEDGETD